MGGHPKLAGQWKNYGTVSLSPEPRKSVIPPNLIFQQNRGLKIA